MRSDKGKALTPSLNFCVFYRICSHQPLGPILASLVLYLSFLEIYCFMFESLLQTRPNSPLSFELFKEFTWFFSTINIIEFSSTLYNVFRYVACAINLAYLFIFLVFRWLIKNGSTNLGVERLFGFYHHYYAKVLLIPIYEILFRDIFCNKTMLEKLDQECFVGEQIFIMLLAILSAVTGLLMIGLTLYYSVSGIYDKKNYLSGNNRLWDMLLVLIRLLLPFMIVIWNDTWTFLVEYISMNVIFSLILLFYFMVFYPYNKQYIEYFALLLIGIYLTESVACLIFLAYENQNMTPDVIFLWLCVLVVPASIYAYQLKKKMLIIKLKVSSTKELLRQIQMIIQLKRTEKYNTHEETVFRGVISQHRANCDDLHCFCKLSELYDPNKRKEFEADKWPAVKPLILKYYVRYLFEEAIEQKALDSDLLISYAEFLFHKFHNTHLALYQIARLVNLSKFLYPSQKLRIFTLQEKISAFINIRNIEELDKSLEIENVIFVEEQLERILEGMKKIIHTSIAFWSYLQNKEIELNKLQTLAKEMDDSVENTTKSWGPLKPYLYKQKKIMYYYNWYLKDFLQKKTILSEDEVDELFENDEISVNSNEFIKALRNDHVIFQEDSSVVHMSGDQVDVGKIINTNDATITLFGYNKQELENARIDIIMPNLIAKRHLFYLNSYIQTGKSRILYNQKRTFAKHKSGFIIPIWTIVKQLNNTEGHVQYVGLLRPLSQKKEEQAYYILLNSFGEVNGVTQNLATYLNLSPNIFQTLDVNIILLAPKLVKYFFFGKLLQKDDNPPNTDAQAVIKQGLTRIFTSRKSKMFPETFSPFMGSIAKKNNIKDFMDLDEYTEEDGVIGNGEEYEETDTTPSNKEVDDRIEVEFTLRLPKKLKAFVKDFNESKSRHHDLLNNQQFILEAIRSKSLNFTKLEEPATHSDEEISKTKKKIIGNIANFKHAVDAYVEALHKVATRIVKSGQNNVYRIKGIIGTDYYGPEKDVIKYIKILDITKKVEKFGHSGEATPSKAQSKILEGFQSVSSNLPLKTLQKMKKSSPFSFKALNRNLTENIESEPPQDEDGLMSPQEVKIKLLAEKGTERELESSFSSRSKSVKHQGSLKSYAYKESQSEGALNEVSHTTTNRKEIMNELKNNILTPNPSIYQKEDNLMIDRNFRSLTNITWFIRFLFLAIIPINIIIFFVGPYSTFIDLGNSVNVIYINEDLRRDSIRCHDAVITLMLDNIGTFDSLKPALEEDVENLMQAEMDTIQSSYEHIFERVSTDEWAKIIYNYGPQAANSTSLNYQGSFKGSVIDIGNAIQKLTNAYFEIRLYDRSQFVADNPSIDLYRKNSFEKYNKILGDVTIAIFDSLDGGFSQSENLSIIILICEGLLFFCSFFFILRLILVVLKSLREILIIFTVIDTQQINETEFYYKQLLGYLEISNSQYLTVKHHLNDHPSRNELVKVKNAKQNDDQKQFKKAKKVNQSGFMRRDFIRVLSLYVLSITSCFALSLTFHFQSKTTVDFIQDALADGRKFLQLSPVYITSLIGLKEITFNKTTYELYDLPYMGNIINQLETALTRTGYASDLGFVDLFRNILTGTPCEAFKDDIEEENSSVKYCNQLSLGRLANGLISFHNYYESVVTDTLRLRDQGNFGGVGPNELYQFSQLIRIIDGVFMEETLIRWRDDMKDYISFKENFLALLIAFVSILNVGVYFVAKRGVVSILEDRFLFYRKIYNDYMLGEASFKEKRIKAILTKYKLLNK